MNKATFVSSIPSKIEGNEVPTVELVQKMIPEVVSEFNSQSSSEKYIFKIKPDSKLSIRGDFQTNDLSKDYVLQYGVYGKDNVSLTFTINGQSLSEFGIIDKFEYKPDNQTYSLCFHEPLTENTEIIVQSNEAWAEKVFAEIIPEKSRTDINQKQVMTSSGVSDFVSSCEIKSSQISDRIQEYNPTSRIPGEVVEYLINGKEIKEFSDICSVQDSYGPFTCQYLEFNSQIYTNQKVKVKTEFTSSNISGPQSDRIFGNFITYARSTTFQIAPNTRELPNGEYKITVEFQTQGPLEISAKVRNTQEILTMNEDQLMTANAVRGYVEKKLAALESRITALEGKTQ